jgi:hypothetical protein
MSSELTGDNNRPFVGLAFQTIKLERGAHKFGVFLLSLSVDRGLKHVPV